DTWRAGLPARASSPDAFGPAPRAPLAVLGSLADIGYLPGAPGVEWRSSRRRSSAPCFQIAYSSESPRAVAEAAMMLVSEPIVDHSAWPSVDSIVTRVRAPVAAPESRMRTL